MVPNNLVFSSPFLNEINYWGNSLEVQGLGLQAFSAEGAGSIPSQGTKVPTSRPATRGERPKKEEKDQFLVPTFPQHIT